MAASHGRTLELSASSPSLRADLALLFSDSSPDTLEAFAGMALSPDVEYILEVAGSPALVNAQTHKVKRTALLSAAEKGDVKIFDMLLDNGADVMMRNAEGCGVLHLAVNYNNRKLVQRILDKLPKDTVHALLSQKAGEYRDTPMMLACEHGHEQIVSDLLKYKPDVVNDVDSAGNTPLQ